MDVGDPSNFIRILALFHDQFEPLKNMMSSVSISDEETGVAIRTLFQDYHYTADPHGAVGWLALHRWLELHPEQKGIFLETAHAVKFPDAVQQFTNQEVPVPDSIRGLFNKKKNSITIEADYKSFIEILTKNG
jgi:threonine synthase